MSVRILQLASLIGSGIISLLVLPWFRRASRSRALIALLAVHACRVVILVAIPAQQAGYPLSNQALAEIVVGDLLGAALAIAGIIALLRRSRLGIALSWLVVIEIFMDFVAVVHRRIAEPINVEPSGPLFFVIAFFGPFCIATVPVMIWQLVSRRGEPLTSNNSQVTSQDNSQAGRSSDQTIHTMEQAQ